MKKFEEYLSEDACATLGNTGGMGSVVSAQPSSTPGDVAGGVAGSGDIGSSFATSVKSAPKLKKRKKLKSYSDFKPSKEK